MNVQERSTRRPKADEAAELALERIIMLWNLGDWPELIVAAAQCRAEQQNTVAIYKIAALLQCYEVEQANSLLASLSFTEIEHQLLARLLVSGVVNAIGKAKACNYEHAPAEQCFKDALEMGLPYTSSSALVAARTATQLAQLGIPYIPALATQHTLNPDFNHVIHRTKALFAHEPAFELALADYHQRQQAYDQAIVHWQQVSALLDKDMPQPYYDRLKEAYKSVKGFPLGTVEQEALRGDIDKHKLLSLIHQQLCPAFYFEIGVQTGKSLALAKCEAIGVDPMPLLNVPLGANAKVLTSSSDAFFEQKSDVLFSKSLDFAFIDGMHLFEYALRDFINTERHAKPYSLIVIDDIYPGHSDQAKRDRCTRAWTGDVWKVKAILQQYRPDLLIVAVDAYPTGLLLITGLDPTNTVLADNYAAIVQEFMSIETVPEHIMQRSDAVSGHSKVIGNLLALVKNSKTPPILASTMQQKWAELPQ